MACAVLVAPPCFRIRFKPLSKSESLAEDADAAENGGVKSVSLSLNKSGTAMNRYGSSGETLQNTVGGVGANPSLDEAPAGDMVKQQEVNGSGVTGGRHDAEQHGDGHGRPNEEAIFQGERDDEGGSNPTKTEAHQKDAALGCWGGCSSSLRLFSDKRVKEVTAMYGMYSVSLKLEYRREESVGWGCNGALMARSIWGK